MLTISDADKAAALGRVGIAPGTTIVAFAPGAEFGPAKRWPSGYFAGLARLLQQSRPEITIVLMGSAKDAEVCDEIVAAALACAAWPA